MAAPRFTPLTQLIGVNLLTAGILAGISARVTASRVTRLWPHMRAHRRSRPPRLATSAIASTAVATDG